MQNSSNRFTKQIVHILIIIQYVHLYNYTIELTAIEFIAGYHKVQKKLHFFIWA